MQFLQGLQAEALELHPLHSSCSYSDLRGAGVKLRCGSIYTHTAQCQQHPAQGTVSSSSSLNSTCCSETGEL